jgi:hypothetical protein
VVPGIGERGECGPRNLRVMASKLSTKISMRMFAMTITVMMVQVG